MFSVLYEIDLTGNSNIKFEMIVANACIFKFGYFFFLIPKEYPGEQTESVIYLNSYLL